MYLMWGTGSACIYRERWKKKNRIEELPEGRKFRQKVPTPGESKKSVARFLDLWDSFG